MTRSEANGLVAYHRDGEWCMYHYHVLNQKVPGSEADHVFGRVGDEFLDHWILRLTLCKACHHQKHHGGTDIEFDQGRELGALVKANLVPIAKPWLRHGRQLELAVAPGWLDWFNKYRQPAAKFLADQWRNNGDSY